MRWRREDCWLSSCKVDIIFSVITVFFISMSSWSLGMICCIFFKTQRSELWHIIANKQLQGLSSYPSTAVSIGQDEVFGGGHHNTASDEGSRRGRASKHTRAHSHHVALPAGPILSISLSSPPKHIPSSIEKTWWTIIWCKNDHVKVKQLSYNVKMMT